MTGGVHLSVRRGEGKGSAAGGAPSAGLRGRDGPAERPRPSGERGSGRLERRKNEWAAAGPKGRMGRKRRKKFFSE
jgi:hypothetical protein